MEKKKTVKRKTRKTKQDYRKTKVYAVWQIILCFCGVLSIVMLELFALSKGIDGIAMSTSCAVIGILVGWGLNKGIGILKHKIIGGNSNCEGE